MYIPEANPKFTEASDLKKNW